MMAPSDAIPSLSFAREFKEIEPAQSKGTATVGSAAP